MTLRPGVRLALHAGCYLAAVQAMAQPATGDMAACVALRADAQRLACYDRLATSLGIARPPASAAHPADASAAPPPLTPAAPAASESAEQRFGLTKPPVGEPRGPQTVSATVTGVSPGAANNVSVTLDNGQTWAFNAGVVLLRPGDAVTIKKAALGSFMMVTPSKRTYQVRRTQ